MSKEEKKDMDVIPFIKSFPVYNVAQTNLADVQPERMQKLMDRFKVPELRDTEGMYTHAALDRMVETQQWLKDSHGKRISTEEYRAMSKEEKKDMDVIPFIKSFPVYNVAQTNLAEVQPERMQKLMDRFKVPELRDTEGMYTHAALDRMVETQQWLCPIRADKRENGAYYSPSKDIVVLPMKAQFNIGASPEETYRGGMEYYSTMLHEMTHSTMTPERLNREMGGRFGDPKYAKEELVAELTAAMISHSMGFDSRITDNSAAYLDSWIGVLKQEPKFIVSVMADVNKASDLILDHVDKQRLALGEQPYLAKNDPLTSMSADEEKSFKNAAIVKTRSGDYAIRASYDGVELGLKKVSKETARTFFQLTDWKDKGREIFQECGHCQDPFRRLCHPCVIRWRGAGTEEGFQGNGQDILPAYGLEGQGGFPEHDGTEDIRTRDYHDEPEPECRYRTWYMKFCITS